MDPEDIPLGQVEKGKLYKIEPDEDSERVKDVKWWMNFYENAGGVGVWVGFIGFCVLVTGIVRLVMGEVGLSLMGIGAIMAVVGVAAWKSSDDFIQRKQEMLDNWKAVDDETEQIKKETAMTIKKNKEEHRQIQMVKMAEKSIPLLKFVEEDWPRYRDGNSPLQQYIEADLLLLWPDHRDRRKVETLLKGNFDAYLEFMLEYEGRSGLSADQVRYISQRTDFSFGKRIQRYLEQMKLEQAAGKEMIPAEKAKQDQLTALTHAAKVLEDLPEEIRKDPEQMQFFTGWLADQAESHKKKA